MKCGGTGDKEVCDDGKLHGDATFHSHMFSLWGVWTRCRIVVQVGESLMVTDRECSVRNCPMNCTCYWFFK